MGLRSRPGIGLTVHAYHQDRTSSSRRQPYHHDLRPLQSIRALAAGFGWRAQPGCGGSHMEPPVSGPLALPCCLARPLPALLILGRLE